MIAWVRGLTGFFSRLGLPVRKALLAIATLAIALAFVPSATSLAQEIKPPPRHDSRSPTGVSYRNGSFSFEEEDLTIGGGSPDGLTLLRSYNSGVGNFTDPFGARGWTGSLNIYIVSNRLPEFPVDPQIPQLPTQADHCVYNIVGGPRSIGFLNLSEPGDSNTLPPMVIGCGGNVPGNYAPIEPTGDKLEFIGAANTGYFLYTGANGDIIKFAPTSTPRAEYWTMPNGTRLDFYYEGSKLKNVTSSRGWMIIMESTSKVCAVNLAQVYVASTASACPANVQTVTYQYGVGTYGFGAPVLTSRTKAGETRTYRYANNNHIDCIKDPGQTNCRITNTYFSCPEVTGPVDFDARQNDPVISQVRGDGATITYSMSLINFCPPPLGYTDPDLRPFSENTATVTEPIPGGTATTLIKTDPSGKVTSVRDALNRPPTTFVYDPGTVPHPFDCCQIDTGPLLSVTYSELNKVIYGRDDRGNITSKTERAKPGSGLPDLVTTATFPGTCSNIITCNKPTAVTDPRGGTTDYTYDPTHGGVLTETGPADANGVRPVKRNSYMQRYASILSSLGAYSQSPYPVWLLSETRTCRSSATISGSCASGSADEVVTTFDYGPTSGPNNLLLRGQTVTSQGQTLRTCYGYDQDGRKISETAPNANLTSCP